MSLSRRQSRGLPLIADYDPWGVPDGTHANDRKRELSVARALGALSLESFRWH